MLAALGKLTTNRRDDQFVMLDKARPLLKADTTAVLFTPQGGAAGLGGRGGMIPVGADEMNRLFEFAAGLDFSLGWSGD